MAVGNQPARSGAAPAIGVERRADDDSIPGGEAGRSPRPLAARQRVGPVDRAATWLALAVCSALVALVYGQALGFAFTFDDPLDLPRAEGRSVWSLLSSSEGYAYYRPIPFILWNGLRALQGRYSEASLHGLTLVAHVVAAWLLYLLLRRLTGGHWGLLAAVLFIVYPFSYQAVFGAHTLFHPLMTAAILASLLLYHDACLGARSAERGARNKDEALPAGVGTGIKPAIQPVPRSALRAPRLAGSLLAAVVALWTHESGVVILPLVAGLELLLLARSGGRRPAWWPLLHGAATALFILVWYTVPRFERPEPWSTSLGPNARYFLQGVIYPVSAQLRSAGERWGFDPLRAVWPAVVATLLALLALYALGRRPWTPLVALVATAVVLAPAWLVLSWAYVEDAPRLLYPAAPAIAALWGLLPSLRFGSRSLTWLWRAVSLALLAAVVAQSLQFIALRRDMWAEGTVLVEGVADAAARHGERPLLFLNVPAWFAPKRPEYPLGHVGFTALPGYIGLGRSVYIHRGVQPPIESRGYYPDLNGWKYDFNTHGGPATIEEFGALLRRVDAVYDVAMLPNGAQVRLAGELRPGGAGVASQGPRFGPGLVLTTVDLQLADGAIAGDLTWDVAAPPPGDYLPVLSVRDKRGAVIAATGGYPIAGVAAPRLWQAGDRVRDLPRLRLPEGLPPGAYTVWLTWQERTTRQALPAVGADGATLGPEGLRLGGFSLP